MAFPDTCRFAVSSQACTCIAGCIQLEGHQEQGQVIPLGTLHSDICFALFLSHHVAFKRLHILLDSDSKIRILVMGPTTMPGIQPSMSPLSFQVFSKTHSPCIPPWWMFTQQMVFYNTWPGLDKAYWPTLFSSARLFFNSKSLCITCHAMA